VCSSDLGGGCVDGVEITCETDVAAAQPFDCDRQGRRDLQASRRGTHTHESVQQDARHQTALRKLTLYTDRPGAAIRTALGRLTTVERATAREPVRFGIAVEDGAITLQSVIRTEIANAAKEVVERRVQDGSAVLALPVIVRPRPSKEPPARRRGLRLIAARVVNGQAARSELPARVDVSLPRRSDSGIEPSIHGLSLGLCGDRVPCGLQS